AVTSFGRGQPSLNRSLLGQDSSAVGLTIQKFLCHVLKKRSFLKMTKSIRALMMGAALAGFVAGQTVVAQDTGKYTGRDTTKSSGKTASKGKKDKHACKGLNSCKGKGGCGADKGKNECRGKGGCRTDGKPMDKDKS